MDFSEKQTRNHRPAVWCRAPAALKLSGQHSCWSVAAGSLEPPRPLLPAPLRVLPGQPATRWGCWKEVRKGLTTDACSLKQCCLRLAASLGGLIFRRKTFGINNSSNNNSIEVENGDSD